MGAQPLDEDPAPADDNMIDHEPPFDFFGLGRPVNQAPFNQNPEPFGQHQENEGWGQWIQGGTNAAPAANDNLLLMDLNNPAEEANELMEPVLDLNVALAEEVDMLPDDFEDEEDQLPDNIEEEEDHHPDEIAEQLEEDQLSLQISRGASSRCLTFRTFYQ
jgi:hypothetical protein